MNKSLYSDDIKIEDVKTQSQLEDIILKYSKYDPKYVASAVREEFRKVNERNWIMFKNYSDRNYADQIRRPGQYLQKLWEMNLALLISEQLELKRRPKDNEPDIITNKFVIECVCPQPKNVASIKLNTLQDKKILTYSVPQDEIMLRITQSLYTKIRHYWGKKREPKWSNKDYKNLPYIIAISLSDMNSHTINSTSSLNLVEDVLMSLGSREVNIDRDTGEVLGSRISLRSSVTKNKHKEIPLGIFQKRMYSGVSAVIWSNKEYPDGEYINVVHNPLSKNKLDPTLLPRFKHIKFEKSLNDWVRIGI